MAFNNPSITFGSTGLQGESSNNPTALDTSKTGAPVLFVAQQDGTIYRYEIERQPDANGDGTEEFVVTDTVAISVIPDGIQNYNDDGTSNNTAQRQMTGLVTTIDENGNDVLYVSSSDWRIAVGNDTGLDTNSGQIHKITLDSQGNVIENVAILRGLPRSEENHSTNGLDLSIDENGDVILWVAQGGNTNKGAPGNNFAGTVDYALSGTILKVNLTQLESYDIRTDINGDQFILDLPTLNDPSRDDIDLSTLNIENLDLDPNFSLDDVDGNPDWAGGNNGLNQAKITSYVLVSEGGQLKLVDNPLKVHAPGDRNNYDVLVTEAGEIYTWDNGPNGGWGGQPLAFETGQIVDDWTTQLATNQFNEGGSTGFGDQLHYLGTTADEYGPYQGDANPIRASKEILEAAFNSDGSYKGTTTNDPIVVNSIQVFANEAEARSYLAGILIIYEEQGNGNWVDVTSETGLPADLFDIVSGYDWFHPGSSISNPQDYYDGTSIMDGTPYSPESQLFDNNNDGSLKTVNSSTNGLAEYTATFFGGALNGAIIAAAFNGNLYFELPQDTDGDGRTDSVDSLGTINGFGSQPLSVTALGDNGFSANAFIDNNNDGIDDFAGLVIAATYGADNITFFIPGGQPADPSTDLDLDGLNNTVDSHVGDPTEGKGVLVGGNQTVTWGFELNNPDSTPAGAVPAGDSIAGDIGINAVWRNDTTVQFDIPGNPALYNPDVWNLGGASSFVSIDVADDGSAVGAANDQADVLGIGFATQPNTGAVTILTEMVNIFTYSLNNDAPDKTWDGGEKVGLVVGPGDQSNYAEATIAVVDDGGIIKYGVQLIVEENDIAQTVFVEIPGVEDPAILGVGDPNFQVAVDLDLTFGNETAVARARYVDNGVYTDWVETSALAIPDAVVQAVTGNYNNLGKSTGAFVGLVSSAPAGDDSFGASWDFVEVTGFPREFGDGEIIARWNAGGATVAAIDGGPDWVTTGVTITGSSANSTQNAADNGLDASVPPTTPAGIYTNELYGSNAADPLGLEFGSGTLTPGTYAVRLYMGNGFSGTSTPGTRVFDVSVEGELFLDDLDLVDTFGHKVGGMYEWIGTVTDGTVDIDFTHFIENPLINAVEIIALDDPSTGPFISILDESVGESDGTVTVTIQAEETVSDTVNFDYEIRPVVGGATPEVDYTVTGATYIAETGIYTASGSIAANSSDFTFPITILTDTEFEGDEIFGVVITSVSGANAAIGDGTATITIQDDDSASGNQIMFRINAGGAEIAATDGGPNWAADQSAVTANNDADLGTPSPYLVDRGIAGDDVTYGDNAPSGPGVNATGAPDALFVTERFSTLTNPDNIGYAFDVANGDYIVNLYFDELFFGTAGSRIFDVEIEGNLVLDDFDTFAAYGNDTGVESFDTTVSDGQLNIEFFKTATNNPHIAAIEIISANGGSSTPPDSVNGVAAPGGDFSESGAAPTSVTLSAGTTTIVATQEGDPNRDFDYVTITVPTGHVLTGIDLTAFNDYDPNLVNATFLGLQAGSIFTESPANPDPANLLGGVVYDELDVGTAGANLLADMADGAVENFADTQGFTTPLGAGDYTFWWSQNQGSATSTIDFTVEPEPTSGQVVAAINAGGPALTQDGIDFAADNSFVNGLTFADGNAGNGPQPVFDGTVFETERYGGSPSSADPLSYEIAVDAGQYTVELYFAEIFQPSGAGDGIGARVFDVLVEGQLVLDDFDILAQTGGDFNQPVIFDVPGTFSPDTFGNPGALDIDFSASSDNAKVSAIVVRDAGEPDPSGGAATLSVNAGSNNIQISNFNNGSFVLTNTGSKVITQFEIDVTNALYPDSVFDPFGIAGDTVGKALTISGGSGTGVVPPTDPYVGVGGIAGYEGLILTFDQNIDGGFQPTESIGFAVDMDPNSIAGALKSTLDSGANPTWDIGGVSGAELIGSTFTITFAGGTTATGQLQAQTNAAGATLQGGSIGLASQDNPNDTVTLTVNGLGEGGVGTYSDDGPSVIVNGPAGETVRVVLTKGIIQPFENNFPDTSDPNEYHDQLDAQLAALAASDFPANNAAEFQSVDVVLTGLDQDISTLFDFTNVPGITLEGDEAQLPLGFTASLIDPANGNLPTGPLTAPIYLQYAEIVTSDLELSKTVSDLTPAYGDTITFTLNVSNVAGPDATGVTVDDLLPDGFVYVSDTGNGAYDPETGIWTIGTVGQSATETLEITVEVAAPVAVDTETVLFRVNNGGPEIAATDGGPAWAADTSAANHPDLANPGSNNNFSTGTAIDISAVSEFDGPASIFQTERWDNTNDANGEMLWQFDVAAGTEVQINLYFAELFTSLPDLDDSGDPTGDRIFDVSVDGVVPAAFDDIDPYTLGGSAFNVASVLLTIVTSDGMIDLEFLHGSENPAIKAIEIIELGSGTPILPDYGNYAQILTADLSDPDSTPGDNSVGDDDDATVIVDASAGGQNDLSIAATGNAAEPDTNGQFTVSVGEPVSTDTVIAYAVDLSSTATSDADHTALSGTVTILQGETSAVIDVAVLDDLESEGEETVTVTLTGVTSGDSNLAINPASQTATVTIADDEAPQVQGGMLNLAITPGGTLGASTFGPESFQLTNNSDPGVQITSISIDLSTAILPDIVFDPTGAGGDATASPFTPNTGSALTGLIAPADPASDPFSQPRNGGFDILTINFDDFDPGETFSFTTDIDPNSIQSVPGAGNAGAVSGYELIGATVTVTFSDGTSTEVAVGSQFDEGSLGGSFGVVTTEDAVTAPTLSVVGAGPDQVPSLPGQQVDVTGTDFTVLLTGTPGADVELLQMDTRLFIATGAAPFDVTSQELPFYANEAMSGKAIYTGTIGDDGTLEIPVSLQQTPGSGDTPDGGLNYLMAVVTSAGEVSTTSAPLVVKLGAPLVYNEPGIMEFDGSSGPVLEIPHDQSFEIPQGTIAFSFTAADTSGAQGLFTKDASGYAGGGNHFVLYLDGSTLTARFQDGANESFLTFAGIAAGVEYEVAATFGPNGAELWVDGNLVDSDPLVMDWTQNVEYIQWGGRGWGSSSGAPGFDAPFEGSISDKQIYSQVLTASQIAALAATSTGSNQPPAPTADTIEVAEDASITFDPLVNDSDPDGDTLIVSGIATQASNGTASVNPDGTVTYTPNADYNGPDSFEVAVSDGTTAVTSGVTVNVTPVNDDPVAVDDSSVDLINTAQIIDVLANDIDPDLGDTLSVATTTDGANGTVTVNPDGTVTYTPNGGFVGADSFTYTVSDGNGGVADEGTVDVVVLAAPNTPPVAVADDVTVDEDQSVTFQPGANDTDDDGDTVIAAAIASPPSSGSAVVNPDGTVTYTPAADFNGADSFAVTVTDGNDGVDTNIVSVIVNPVNDAPVANNDVAATSEGNPVIINVVDNDTDIDLDTLDVTAVTNGSNGTVVNNGNGTVTYTPDASFDGIDTFEYTISDGTEQATASVSVNVNSFPAPIYDAPGDMTFNGTNSGVLQIPHQPAFAIDQGTVAFAFNAADTSGAQGLFSKDASFFGGGGHHVIYLSGSTLIARFQNGNSTTAQFTFSGIQAGEDYEIATTFGPNGTELWVNGNLVGSNSQPISWLGNEEFIQWGGRGWGSSSGAPGFDAPFEGTISDKQIYGVALSAAQIAVLQSEGPVNNDPVAVADTIQLSEDSFITFDPTDNDSDLDGDPVAVSSISSGPSNGQVVINLDGTVTYTPNANFAGNDSFQVIVSDGNGGFATSTVSVTVDPEEDSPTAVNDSSVGTINTSQIIEVLDNDLDPDAGDTLTVLSATDGSNGSTSVNPDGTVTYTPDLDFVGDDTFSYTITDLDGNEDTATVSVQVQEEDVLPDAIFEQIGVRSYSGSSADVDNIPHNDSLEVSEGTIAFSFVDDNPGVRQGLVVKDASGFVGGGNHFAAYIDQGDLNVRFQDGANSVTFSFDNIVAGQEYEVAAVFGSNGVQLYVDGALVGNDGDFNMDWNFNQEYLQIGGLGWASSTGAPNFGNPFSGQIADVQIFGEALEIDLIQELAQSSSFDIA